ncbi:M56 family metallopeptidase [Paraflavitalea speifideaquila]|uniref:M56 family metallopeptidase n=1 Tax=Paraflavitalea speifideaquila TaxID=3076558 RepID=UPI0028EF4DD7|nr:M56 family metallopeptidase [Paraflavitalea speifideiaquila]
MSIPKKVNIWLSSRVDTPLTVGFWKPIILLPIAAVNNLTIQQTEAIILHELNHIRRNDYLVNLLIACIDIILFFNPFAQLFSGIIRREREHSCDDMVLQFRYDASQYARALLMLEQSRIQMAPALAVAATGHNSLLLNRVKRILSNDPVTTTLNQKLVAWLLSALLIGSIGWYNPGKAIVTTIQEVTVKAPEIPNNEFPAGISTPAAQPAAPSKAATPALAPTIAHVIDSHIEEAMADAMPDADAEAEENPISQLVSLASYKGELAKEMITLVNSKKCATSPCRSPRKPWLLQDR